jgi:hypothetical protein
VTVHELCYGVRRPLSEAKQQLGYHPPRAQRDGDPGSINGASDEEKHPEQAESGRRRGALNGGQYPGHYRMVREEPRHDVPESTNGVLHGAELSGHQETHPPGESPGQRHIDLRSRQSASGKRHKVWVCRACEDPVLKPYCCLCPVRGMCKLLA